MPIELEDLSVSLGPTGIRRTVLAGLTFHIADGEFVAILGPSGCGKSTLLRVLAGFQRPSSGLLRINGQDSPGPAGDRAMVMQQNALFPWMTVLGNIDYPLRLQGMARKQARQTAMQWLDRVGLRGFGEHYPQQISVGMQQKAALARLFTGNAGTLLMDEPFGALDTVARTDAQKLLLNIWEAERRTVAFVTHDVEEALLLADRVLVLGGSPTRLIRSYPIPWSRPREFRLLFTPDFSRLRQELLGMTGAMED